MEGKDGELLDSEVRDEALADARGFWTDCLRKGRGDKLLNSQKYGLEIKEEFRLALERKHPWLRLCAGNWKVYQLWTNHFGSWKRNNMPELGGKDKPILVSSDSEDNADPVAVNVSDDSVVSITDDDSDDNAIKVGRKRSSTDDGNPGTSKRSKGKEVAVAPFHPPKPRPTKTKAKVSRILFLMSLKNSRTSRSALYGISF